MDNATHLHQINVFFIRHLQLELTLEGRPPQEYPKETPKDHL